MNMISKQEKEFKQTTYVEQKTVVRKQPIEFTTHIRPRSLKEYLKQESVKRVTEEKINNVNFSHDQCVDNIGVEVHLKYYCKLLWYLKKLEYHHFDHNWFPNVNEVDSSRKINLNELSTIPGRVDHILKRWDSNHTSKQFQEMHEKILLGYPY